MRWNVNVCCIQETMWKGKKTKEIKDRYKIIYLGKYNARNRVGMILDA